MGPKKKSLGKGAVVLVLLSKLHPSEHIRNKFPDAGSTQRLQGLKVVRQEKKNICKTDQLAVIFLHDSFKTNDGAILYALSFVNLDRPAYKDPFFCVQELIDAWKQNMHQHFSPR